MDKVYKYFEYNFNFTFLSLFFSSNDIVDTVVTLYMFRPNSIAKNILVFKTT